MILEARSAGCFSWTYVLKLNERPIGKYECQWLSESLNISLTERRHLEFQKTSWMGSRFELVDRSDGQIVGDCDRGFFSGKWDVHLSTGPGQLVRAGWFDTAYEFVQGEDVLARVDRLGWCESGWNVDGGDILSVEDLVLIGLVYHTIQRRRQSQQNNAGGHAGS